MEFDLKWLSAQSEHPYYYHVLTIIAALTAHLYYKRYEPTVVQAVSHFAAASIVLLSTLLYKSETPDVLGSLFLVAQCQLVYVASIFTSMTAYRLSPFHPLAKIPGPFLAKITSLYWGSKVYAMTPRLDLGDLHRKYGDFVRIGPNAVSILKVDAINTLYGAKGWIKGPEYIQAGEKNPNPDHASLHLLRNHELHAQRRKTWDKGFNRAALNSYQPVIYTATSRLIEAVEKQIKGSEPLDLHKWTGFFTFDVMRALAFADSGSFLQEGVDPAGILKELHISTDETGLGMAIPWILQFAQHFPMLSSAVEFRKYVFTKYMERRTPGPNSLTLRDVFHYLLLEDLDTNIKPSDAQLVNDAVLVIVAGSDTTHLTMTLAICYLCSHPEIYKQFQAELDEALIANKNVLEIPVLDKLPLLNGIINECLRLQPPVAQGLVRRVPPGGGVVCGQYLPEWTSVRVPVHAIQRDPRCWSVKPDEFRPQRWFAPEKGEVVNKTSWIPFSTGPYSCIGRIVAQEELRCGLAAFFLKFNAKFPPGFDMSQIELGDRFLVNLTSKIPLIVSKRDTTFDYPVVV